MSKIIKKIFIFSLLFFIFTSCEKENNIQNNLENKKTFSKIENKSLNSNKEENIEKKDIEKDLDYNFMNDDKEDENKENDGEINCEQHYKKLFSKYKNDFSECSFSKIKIDGCDIKNTNSQRVNLLIIFDDSGSMRAKIGDKTRLEIAKNSLDKYIREINLENTNLGFLLYGHKGGFGNKHKEESCNSIEEILKLGNKNIEPVLDKIENLEPKGWTPIDKSLKKAKEIINNFASKDDKNIILLISDGKESCDGNPSETAKNISDGKNKIKIDVIGFNVNGESKNQLEKISSNGGGTYFDVKNEIEFEQTFNMIKNSLESMKCGASKASKELEQGLKAINLYYKCNYKIREEQVYIFNNMNEECEDYIINELENRQEKLESDFENLKEQGDEILENYSKHIIDIKNKIEGK